MSHELMEKDKKSNKRPEPANQTSTKQEPFGLKSTAAALLTLQQKVGNRAVQRLLVQRKGGEGFDLDKETADRINGARSQGQPLDSAVQKQMSANMGYDFSGVRVHTSAESDTLNKELSAKAFTTGQDVFFKQGAYDPGSSSGQELLAHELTHVVQQSTGQVGGSGNGMTVRPPGDSFEQEADRVAKQTASPGSQAASLNAGHIQRQEEIQTKPEDMVQRGPEDEEEVQV